MQKILDAYLECALWSSTDENGEPLDDNFSIEDCSEKLLKESENDIQDFLDLLNRENIEWQGEISEEQFGYNFWLTRNGHGAGFWDRGLGELGDALTTWAKTYGTVDLYDYEGKIYC